MTEPSNNSRNAMTGFTLLCITGTLLLALAALAASAFDNGAGSGSFLGLGLYVVFLWLVLPMHLVGLVWAALRVVRGETRRGTVRHLIYYLLWGLLAITVWIRSGLADPWFASLEQSRYDREHASEVELMRLIRRSADQPDQEVADRMTELIALGTDINLADRQFGLTPLHWAAMSGSAATLEPLLLAGPDLEATAPRPWSVDRFSLDNATALELAVWARDNAKIKTTRLLTAGAAPTAQTLVGACYLGELDLLQKLTETTDVSSSRLASGESCIDVAAGAGHQQIVEWLLAAGINPNGQHPSRPTPLDESARQRQLATTLQLVAAGGEAHGWSLMRFVLDAPEEQFLRLQQSQVLRAQRNTDQIERQFRRAATDCNGSLQRLVSAGLAVPASMKGNISAFCPSFWTDPVRR